MSKKFDEQLMKFEITKNKLKMEISLKDLTWLLENSPNNYGENGELIKVKRGKRQEFAEYIVNGLMDESVYDENNCKWLQPLEEIFQNIFEGAEDEFIKYPMEDEE